jgi:hypothetical protein
MWGVTALDAATGGRPPPQQATHALSNRSLPRELGQYLQRLSPARPLTPPSRIGPPYSTCFVASSSCSIVPCVEFVSPAVSAPTAASPAALGTTQVPPQRTCGTPAYPQVPGRPH